MRDFGGEAGVDSRPAPVGIPENRCYLLGPFALVSGDQRFMIDRIEINPAVMLGQAGDSRFASFR